MLYNNYNKISTAVSIQPYIQGNILQGTIITYFLHRNFKKMFALLAKIKRNDLDDGTVVDHHNLGEMPENIK